MDTTAITEKRRAETETVSKMIALYCRGNHGGRKGQLCPECMALAEYAAARVAHCPHMETKTFCSNCRTHCYKPTMREQICAVMRYSGPRMLFHNPVLAIRHLIQTKKEKRNMT
ncbi:MAG: nitrous oxide-stimulated promoter family protein [Clostridia bacterium]|nr:nitrous oxide-stimulated promoter family protein [Clostridia bacterium]